MKNCKQSLIKCLLQQVTEHRARRIYEVIKNRTQYITLVLEDLYRPHNASAVLRTADCFGVQDIHVIEKQNKFVPNNGITRGAAQWITLKDYRNTIDCFTQLKHDGYHIVATSVQPRAFTLTELPVDKKTAIVFGTEWTGISKEAQNLADDFVTIPMYGFTQSYNLSVSVGIVLQELISRIRLQRKAWQLSVEQQEEVILTWLRATVPGARVIEKQLEGVV